LTRRWDTAPRPDQFRELYFQTLAGELPLFNGRGHLMPGVATLLRYLSQRPDCLMGLLTGNWRRSAMMKLQYFGIEDYFTFGAFGDDAADRLDLSGIARRRALLAAPAEVDEAAVFLVVGDTPRDIACAAPADCLSVAVATGEYSLAELAQYNPHYAFSSLADTALVCKTLGLPQPESKDYPNCDAFLRLCSL
jgi:phosphoglycolate phosphatase-like HAD superfamily hydrolase